MTPSRGSPPCDPIQECLEDDILQRTPSRRFGGDHSRDLEGTLRRTPARGHYPVDPLQGMNTNGPLKLTSWGAIQGSLPRDSLQRTSSRDTLERTPTGEHIQPPPLNPFHGTFSR